MPGGPFHGTSLRLCVPVTSPVTWVWCPLVTSGSHGLVACSSARLFAFVLVTALLDTARCLSSGACSTWSL